jgi:hypothetical protein
MSTNLMQLLAQPVAAVIGERVLKDDAYRTRILKEPKKVLSEALGQELPPEVKVEAHENTPTVMNVVVDPFALKVGSDLPKDAQGPIAQVLKKASTDPKFLQKLKTDPKSAVYEASGLEVPKGLELKVWENTATTFHMPIPAKPSAKAELSAAELEQIAGGKMSQHQKCEVGGIASTAACGIGSGILGALSFGITAAVAGGASIAGKAAASGASVGLAHHG